MFILCSKVLTQLLLKVENQGLIHGIKISKLTSTINQLIFIDDSIVFLRADKTEAQHLKECLNMYQQSLGQQVNYAKFGIFYSSNTYRACYRDIYSELGLNIIKSNAKYLGIPMLLTRNKSKDFWYLLSQVKKILQGWKQKTLSWVVE